MSIFEQIFNPNAARAREYLETEKQLPAPAPAPGKGPLDLEGGGVVLKIGQSGDVTSENTPAKTGQYKVIGTTNVTSAHEADAEPHSESHPEIEPEDIIERRVNRQADANESGE